MREGVVIGVLLFGTLVFAGLPVPRSLFTNRDSYSNSVGTVGDRYRGICRMTRQVFTKDKKSIWLPICGAVPSEDYTILSYAFSTAGDPPTNWTAIAATSWSFAQTSGVGQLSEAYHGFGTTGSWIRNGFSSISNYYMQFKINGLSGAKPVLYFWVRSTTGGAGYRFSHSLFGSYPFNSNITWNNIITNVSCFPGAGSIIKIAISGFGSGTTVKIYLDGVLKFEATNPATVYNSGSFGFGGWSPASNVYNIGIDDLLVYGY